MVLILGSNFLEDRILKRCLQTFYGIGPSVSSRIFAKLSIHETARVGSLNTNKLTALSNELSNMTIENDLRRKIRDDIRRLKDMGTYRGRRHAQGLPARGQNTRSQISTARKLNRVERRG